jgi:hypothetical protein
VVAVTSVIVTLERRRTSQPLRTDRRDPGQERLKSVSRIVPARQHHVRQHSSAGRVVVAYWQTSLVGLEMSLDN